MQPLNTQKDVADFIEARTINNELFMEICYILGKAMDGLMEAFGKEALFAMSFQEGTIEIARTEDDPMPKQHPGYLFMYILHESDEKIPVFQLFLVANNQDKIVSFAFPPEDTPIIRPEPGVLH